MFDYSAKNVAKSAAGLQIKAGSSAVAKTVNTVVASINGAWTSVASGDVAITNYSYINSQGVVTTAANTIATGYTATLTVYSNGSAFAVGKWNTVANATRAVDADFDRTLCAKGYAIIGYITIKNATGSTFTGGTTALDDSNVTTTYVDAYNSLGV